MGTAIKTGVLYTCGNLNKSGGRQKTVGIVIKAEVLNNSSGWNKSGGI